MPSKAMKGSAMKPVLMLAAGVMLASPTISNAASFLDGAYGSKDGCKYAKTGDSSGADDFFLLKDDGITTAMAVCEFKGAATKTPNGFTIKTQCEAEGEKGDEELATLTKSAKGYTVTLKDGTKWGPAPKCR